MDDRQAHLVNCFLAVFPELSPEEVAGASSASVKSWDSTAGVTLVAAIEEEFGVTIEIDDMSKLDSFDHVLQYLREAGIGD
jgi:acyl carrier protein